jgi:hypothetical protein
MAYYPLKVKDNSGNTHVVGDPRTADKADKASPALTGTPTAPTAAADTDTTQVATTAFVVGQASSATPSALGTAAVGNSLRYARANHVHAMPSASDVGAVANALIANSKGALITSNGTAVAALSVGATNGHALKINSATATGLEWGAVTTTGEDDQIVLAVQVFG